MEVKIGVLDTLNQCFGSGSVRIHIILSDTDLSRYHEDPVMDPASKNQAK